MKHLIINMIITILMLVFSSCSDYDSIQGEGPKITKSLTLATFDKLETHISSKINISQGEEQSVTVIGNQNIIDNLTREHIQYLESLPLYLKFQDITIVHGGIQNHIYLDNLSKREVQNILRLRYLDKEENFVAYGKEDENSIFWADVYNGSNGFVVYGHQWFNDVKKNDYSLGIDTGCVYGNKLSAIIFEQENTNNFKILSVQAEDVRL